MNRYSDRFAQTKACVSQGLDKLRLDFVKRQAGNFQFSQCGEPHFAHFVDLHPARVRFTGSDQLPDIERQDISRCGLRICAGVHESSGFGQHVHHGPCELRSPWKQEPFLHGEIRNSLLKQPRRETRGLEFTQPRQRDVSLAINLNPGRVRRARHRQLVNFYDQ